MRLAIHHNENSFSERWIKYCEENSIEYKLVDCYKNNILDQLKDVDVLLFNWWHHDVKAVLFMRQLTQSLENIGIRVFPNIATSWHYDDKVGQKYLLETLNVPVISTYVFYDKDLAMNWVESTVFPKVFKLRGGAGSMNVKLINDKNNATKIINKAFGKGFSVNDRKALFKDRVHNFQRNKDIKSLMGLFKGFVRLFIPTKQERSQSNEKGYVYFQDFIPNNDSDIRVIVVGNKAFGIKRYTRKGDFRASGSGVISYSKLDIDERCIQIAFETAKKMKAQSVAFDFVFDNDKPLIVEVSYAFSIESYDACEGYWDENLNFYSGSFTPQDFMIQDILRS